MKLTYYNSGAKHQHYQFIVVIVNGNNISLLTDIRSFCDNCAASDCSLDDDSIATLVCAFVNSRVDYCVGLLAGAPKKTTDKLQRVLNAAA